MKKKLSFMEIAMETKSQNPNPNKTPTPKSQLGSARKPYDLRERAFDFAVRMLSVSAAVQAEGGGKVVAEQLSRSGPSVGANIEEADGAVSKADKKRSFIIARKEARETRYWLRLVERLWGAKVSVREDIGEATQLLYILSSIIDKLQ